MDFLATDFQILKSGARELAMWRFGTRSESDGG
jgi:hypothetical protein